MTDNELNEQVARKLGWAQCCNPRTMENGKIVDCFGWSKGGSHFHEAYPHYCTDIKAAWEIVEKERYAFFSRFPKGQENEKHDAWICNSDGVLYSAKTAPMAIVKAFLKMEESK